MFPPVLAASPLGWFRTSSRLRLGFSVLPLFALSSLFAPAAVASIRRPLEMHVEALDVPPPPVREGGTVVASDRAIYVLGGHLAGAPQTTIERYDPMTRTWDVVREGLLPRAHAAALFVEDRLYIFGGQGEFGPEARVEVWDEVTGTIERKAAMPTPRYDVSAALFQGRIYVAGGTLGWGRTATVEIYDPRTDAWYLSAPLTEARDTHLVVTGDALYALGGATDSGVSVRIDRLVGNRWVHVDAMAKPSRAYAAAVRYGQVILVGDDVEPGRVMMWTPVTGRWREVRLDLTPRRYGDAVTFDGAIYVFGGERPSGEKIQGPERVVWR